MRDQLFAASHAVRSHLAGHARTQDLLRSSRTDLEERLERFAIHPGPRQILQLADDLV